MLVVSHIMGTNGLKIPRIITNNDNNKEAPNLRQTANFTICCYTSSIMCIQVVVIQG